MKKIIYSFLTIFILIGNINVNALTHEVIYAEADDSVNNGYNPTQLANGDFETYPDNGEISPTGGLDWQTSETTKIRNMGHNGYFEWIDFTQTSAIQKNYQLASSNGSFVEMNANNPAVLYQNLTTNPGDIILWKLSHATRNKGSTDIQEMEVLIGENGLDQPFGTDPKIINNLAIYKYDGIENTDGEYGYLAGGIEDLAALRMNRSTDWRNEIEPWKIAKAVYTIPEGQTSTRFAFKSDTGSTSGNFLDDVVFTTLLGNLKIDTTDPDNVIVSGYWADVEENENVNIKYLVREKLSKDIVVDGTVDMSNLKKENKTGFLVKIPYNGMNNSEYTLEISHEKYNTAMIAESFAIDDIESKNIVEAKKDDAPNDNLDNNKSNNIDKEENKNEKVIEISKSENIDNPKTLDSIVSSFILVAISLCMLVIFIHRKNKIMN